MNRNLLFFNSFSNVAKYCNRNISWFANIPMGPPDAILGITEAFRKDENPLKINLGVGAYRDDDGKPFVLPSVRMAEENILNKNFNKEYAPIAGDSNFCNLAIELALGSGSISIAEKRNSTVQSISGTGALRIGAAFLNKFWSGQKEVFVPTPTWPNHFAIFEHSGIKVSKYRYYDPKTCGFDFEGCKHDICNIPKSSIILLHACAHNPTGVDPTHEQWLELSALIKEKELLPFFDLAYQGFASGDLVTDAAAIKMFEQDGHMFLLAQSFAKNMGLYGERVGAFTVISDNHEEANRVLSQLKILIRPLYSSPPINGARIAIEILNSSTLKEIWYKDLQTMANRVIGMRKQLKEKLLNLGSSKPWEHITNQIGMFCFTGLSPEQVLKLTNDYHIYLTNDGRISMAGVTTKNVEYLASSIHEVTK